jgi:hypothetical protein
MKIYIYIYIYIYTYTYTHNHTHTQTHTHTHTQESQRASQPASQTDRQITYKHVYTEGVGAVHELLAQRELIGRLAVWDLLFNLV